MRSKRGLLGLGVLVRKIIIASGNEHKCSELRALLGVGPWEVTSLAEYSDIESPEEAGLTFEANARIKAEAIAQATGEWALADDSGLSVDCLGGDPGVRSARYAGPEQDDARNNAQLLADLINVAPESRAARFVCVLALARPDAETVLVRGECEGVVASSLRGNHGFGYDPLFYLPERGQMMAELSPAEKNQISHRARAVRAMRNILVELLAKD